MRNPLILTALLYVAGIVLGSLCPGPLLWLFIASSAVALIALLFSSARKGALLLLLPLVGWANLTCRMAVISPDDLRILIGSSPVYLHLRGRLCGAPVYRETERNHRLTGHSMAEVDVEAARIREDWQRAFGRVAVSTPGPLGPQFFAGRKVEIVGVLQSPKGPAAPGQFDYRAYLRYRGVFYQLRVGSSNDWTWAEKAVGLNAPAPPWTDRFNTWARAALARGLFGEDESLRLLWAMVLGWQTALTQEVAEPFMQSGTLHIFAISGLHIALISGILVSVLRVVRMPRAACGWLVIPLIWFYTLATGWQASAIRSTVMMTIIILGWALERPSHLLNSLAAAGLIILAWDPCQFFQAGFQLSFFVVLGLALIVPVLEKVRRQLLQPDPLLPAELRPKWKKCLDVPVRVLTTSFATSLAAWLGSMPLIAYYFNMITPGSLLANLVIVPLSSIALMSGLASLVCAPWGPFFGELFNHGSWLWMELMIGLSHWFASLPGAYFNVRQPGSAEFVIYYLMLGGLLSGYLLAPQRRRWAAAGAIVLLLGWFIRWQIERTSLAITILPVRAGAVFIDGPGTSNDLLVDCGDVAAGEAMVKPFLRSQGVNRMAGLLLSHGDLAHVGGNEVISSRFRIRQIFTGSGRSRSPVFRELLGRLERTPGQWRCVEKGNQVLGWSVLHPDAQDQFRRAEDSAVVLRRNIHGTTVLLLSDLGRLGQRKLLERESDLRAEILIAGLSNSEFLSDALLDAVDPRLLIVASAEYPIANRPNRKLMERLARRKFPIIYTSEAGAAILRFSPGGWQLKTMDGRHADAGTLAFDLPVDTAENKLKGGEQLGSESDADQEQELGDDRRWK